MAEFSLPANSKIGVGETYKAAAGTKNVKTFKVYRWTPDDGKKTSELSISFLILISASRIIGPQLSISTS